jgi:hypothetical protein
VKSLSHEVEKEAELTPVPAEPQSARSKRTAERMAKSGKWVESLRCSDVNRLWSELHRIVSHHPLVRASRSAGLLVEEGATTAYTDLTQELFVQLLSKNRFEHYLESEMTDYEIECEIGQIELTNLLTAELRKRHPESYRLARRISTLIQSSSNFRRFDSSGSDLANGPMASFVAIRMTWNSEFTSFRCGLGIHVWLAALAIPRW